LSARLGLDYELYIPAPTIKMRAMAVGVKVREKCRNFRRHVDVGTMNEKQYYPAGSLKIVVVGP
jgi:hypothetical protein